MPSSGMKPLIRNNLAPKASFCCKYAVLILRLAVFPMSQLRWQLGVFVAAIMSFLVRLARLFPKILLFTSRPNVESPR